MRADLAAAERRHAVREAAAGWRHAESIDETALAAIRALYPDDRVRAGAALRVLLAAFTFLAVSAALGWAFAVVSPSRLGWILLLAAGAAMAAATEWQTGPLRLAGFGTEEASALLAVGFLAGGTTWLVADLVEPGDAAVFVAALALATAACGAAAWRWGGVHFAAAAAAGAFLLLARLPGGRLLWIAAALAAAPLLHRASRSPGLAPAHRRGALAALLVALVALYAALHPESVEASWVESLGVFPHGGEEDGTLVPIEVAWLAASLVPLAVLAAALRRRDRWLLALGFLALATTTASACDALDLGPQWALLAGAGALLVAAALALRRFLESGRDRERFGFTTQPVAGGPAGARALEIAAALAALSPAPHAQPAEPGWRGGGGEFGGGGAQKGF